MRSGEVVGTVQEKVACNRMPAPIRHLQPLSQGLAALPAPLTQGSQAPRGVLSEGAKLCGGGGGFVHPAMAKDRF